MNILQIAPQIPFPLIDGGKLGIYGITKALSERNHTIDLISYLKDSDLALCKDNLNSICNLYAIEANVENQKKGVIKNLYSDVPYNIEKFKTAEFEDGLIQLLQANKYYVVHIDHLHMAWTFDIVKKHQNIPVILRQHNLEMKIMERYSQEASNPLLKYYCKIQAKKFLKYEVSTCAKFDNCMMITQADEEELLRYNSAIHTSVIPAGVDEKLFALHREEHLIENFSIVHLGSMEWLPNKAGLEWYLSEVFPKIIDTYPNVKLYLIGKGTDKIAVNEQIRNNVIPMGFVDDLWNTIMKMDLAIVPLRSGSGMRIKIIELLAAGQNILSTSIGAEGINITDNKNILLADSAEDFAQKSIEYFNNKFDKFALSKNAKEFCSNNYRWEKIAENIEKVYLNTIKNYNHGN